MSATISNETTDLWIRVYGTPQPQGSKIRKRFQVLDDNAERLHPWRDAVKSAAEREMGDGWDRWDCSVWMKVEFFFARPASHFRTGRNAGLLRTSAPFYPAGRPDLDKLVRAVGDALTMAGVWQDDSQIVSLVAGKRYLPAPGDRPCASIRIGQSTVLGAT